MKLAIVRQKYNPAGGAERFVQNALQEIAKSSTVQIDLLARKWVEYPLVHFVKIDPFYMGSLWRDKSFAQAVKKYLSKTDYDIVQSHERFAGCDIFRAGDGLHVKWLQLRERAGFPASRFNLYHSYIKNSEKELFESDKLKIVICNSKVVMEEIKAFFPSAGSKCRLVYNGVDLNRFSFDLNNPRRAAVRNKLGIAMGVPVFVFVGSGFQRKGLKLAIEAVAEATKDGVLIVVGGDKNQTRYKQYANEVLGVARHMFVGQTRPDDYLACADAFILPTLYDPFPNSAMEAFASGLPVFTTKQCGASDIIHDGQNGYAFDYFDKKGRIDSVRNWLSQRGRWDEMRQNARSTVSGMSIEHSTKQMMALYEELLQ